MKVRSVPIGEVCTIVGGGTPATNVMEYYGGSIPWVTPKDMKTWDIHDAQISITEAGLQNSATRLVPLNSVLVVVRSGVLKHTVPVAINRVPVAINQDMKALLCSKAADPNYVARFVKERSPVILQWVRATTADNFPIDKLKRLELPLPPLSEQRRIAAILDKADELRAKRRAVLAKLDSLTQSIFLDMFGDPATNERNWPTKLLKELCHSITDIDHNMPATVEQGMPFISAKDLTVNGHISFDDVKRITPEDFRRLSRKSKPEKGDIIYSRIGVNLGKARMVEVQFDFLASYSCCTIKPDLRKVDATYLCQLLDSPFILRQARRGIRAIAVPDLGLGEIKAFRIIVPSIELQREFACRIFRLRSLKDSYRASAIQMDKMFASLQYRAFRGELSSSLRG